MLTTWFGVLWPGNPFVLAISILTRKVQNNHTGLNSGLVAMRFATVELAELFIKLFDGLQIYYMQYDQPNTDKWQSQEWKLDRRPEPVKWYFTDLEISFTIPEKQRKMSKRNFPHRQLLRRLESGKPEHMLWQSHYATYDYPLWSLNNVVWKFNPYTGKAFDDMYKDDPDAERLIHHPDASYWEAMGMHHLRTDGSIKVYDNGLWLNSSERAYADNDQRYITEAMHRARQPTFHMHTDQNYRAVRGSASQTPGQASSKTPRSASASTKRGK